MCGTVTHLGPWHSVFREGGAPVRLLPAPAGRDRGPDARPRPAPAGRRPRGRGLHRDPGRRRRDARRPSRSSTACRCTGWPPGCRGSCRSTRSRPPELRRRLVDGGFDVAHVQTGVVSPFAWDSTRVTVGLGLPTAMTWHCMLAGVAPVFGAGPLRAPVGGARRRDVGRVRRRRRAAAPARRAGRLGRGAAQRHRRRALGRRSRRRASRGRCASSPPCASRARKRPAALVELVAEAERVAGPGSRVADGAGGGARPPQGRGPRARAPPRLGVAAGARAARRAARAVCRRRRLPVTRPSRVVRDRSPRGAHRRACRSSADPVLAWASS